MQLLMLQSLFILCTLVVWHLARTVLNICKSVSVKIQEVHWYIVAHSTFLLPAFNFWLTTIGCIKKVQRAVKLKELEHLCLNIWYAYRQHGFMLFQVKEVASVIFMNRRIMVIFTFNPWICIGSSSKGLDVSLCTNSSASVSLDTDWQNTLHSDSCEINHQKISPWSQTPF